MINKYNFFINILIIFVAFLPKVVYAEKEFYQNKLNTCVITKNIIDNYEPEKFESNNNLLSKQGVAPKYCGYQIIIRGKVLDKNCVPVSNAIVYLWQIGCDQKYPYTALKNVVNQRWIDLSGKYSFTGSGTAITNNQGEFYFITMYPTKIKTTPYATVRVHYKDISPVQTKLYFSDKYLIQDNAQIVEPLQDFIFNSIVYDYQIVLPTETSKRY
ncbi:MAG: dioxygenase [Rickettsiaceae bacterium]